jgi:hypothetical protein
MSLIGAIRAIITADDAEFQRAVRRSIAGSRDAANAMGKWGAAAAAAAAAAGAAVFKSTAESVKQLDALSYAANTSVADLQRLAYGARSVGIESEQLAKMLQDVNDKLGDFDENSAGPMADFFKNIGPKVGVTAEQFKNLSGPDALQLYVSSLEKANLSQAEMTFYMEALASDSTLLTPLLRDNGKAMGELSAEAEKLGIGLSEIDVAKVQQANAAMGKIAGIADSAAQRFTVVFAPAVAAALEEVVNLAAEFGGFGQIAENALGGTVKAVGVMANGVRGIQVIVKGLEVGFEGLAFAVNLIFLSVSRNIDMLINSALASVNVLIAGLNKIPGVGIDSIENFVNPATTLFIENTKHWKDAIAETLDEMHNLAMQELPSEAIERWTDTVKAKAQEAAEAVVAAQAGRSMDTSGGSAQGLSPDDIKAIEERLNILREASMSEVEIMAQKYESDQELLVQALENEMITREEYNILAQEAAQRHADSLVAIDQSAADERTAIEQRHQQAIQSMQRTTIQSAGALLDQFAGKSKAAAIASIAVNKGLAMAQNIQNTLVAQTRALAELGPILGPPAAAKIGMYGKINGALIAATGFAQAGAAMSGGASAQVFSGGVPAVNTASGGSGGPSRNISISLSGSSVGAGGIRDLIFGAGGIRDLIAEINNAVGDGVQLGVTS